MTEPRTCTDTGQRVHHYRHLAGVRGPDMCADCYLEGQPGPCVTE